MSADYSSLEARARVHAALGDPARLAIVDVLLVADASPGELARTLDMPSNLVAHHLSVLQEAGLVTRSRSEGDRRRTYVRLIPAVMAGLAASPAVRAPRVVFVCSHNSARSPLAAALWTRHSRIPAASAGTEPAARVHPRARRVARRHGLTIPHTRPVHLTDVVRPDDLLVAVCDSAHEHLRGQPGRRLHWSVPDPAAADTDEAFETAYADLADRIDRLAPTLSGPTP